MTDDQTADQASGIIASIRTEAQRLDWTAADLARFAGVGYATAWRMLHGDDWRGEANLCAALDALGLKIKRVEED